LTETFCGTAPVAETVTIAERPVAKGFASAVTVIVLFPTPEAGLAASQLCPDKTVQFVFDETEKVAELPAVAATSRIFGETERITSAASWVTVTVCGVAPFAETVTIAALSAGDGLALAETVMEPLPVPVDGLTLSHAWLEATVQLALDEMVIKAVLPLAEATFNVPGETERVAAPAN